MLTLLLSAYASMAVIVIRHRKKNVRHYPSQVTPAACVESPNQHRPHSGNVDNV